MRHSFIGLCSGQWVRKKCEDGRGNEADAETPMTGGARSADAGTPAAKILGSPHP